MDIAMSRLRTDLMATLFGQGWAAVIGLLFVPVFVDRLGIEAYGLIALAPVCVALLQVLDAGLAVTLNREMARAVASGAEPTHVRSTARTLLVTHFGLGLAVAALALAALPATAGAWLTPQQTTASELESSLWVLGVAAVLNWPVPLLQNGLMGLGRQPLVNFLIALNATAVNVGAAALVLLYRSDVSVYFAWLAFCNVLHALALGTLFRRELSRFSGQGEIKLSLLRAVIGFSGGAAGISMTGVVLTYIDRLVASKLLTLEQFGYYGLAATIGRSVYLVIAPIFSAVFPRLSALVARREASELEALYSKATQIMAVAVFPPAAVILWFGFEVGLAWLGSSTTAMEIAGIAAMLALGAMINGLMHLPYGLQLAHGMTRLGLQVNVALLCLFVPASVALHSQFGALGIAAAWPLLNAAYFAVAVPLTHRLLRFGRSAAWITRDVLPVAAASFASVGAAHVVIGPATSRVSAFVVILAALAFGYAAAGLSSARFREYLRRWAQG